MAAVAVRGDGQCAAGLLAGAQLHGQGRCAPLRALAARGVFASVATRRRGVASRGSCRGRSASRLRHCRPQRPAVWRAAPLTRFLVGTLRTWLWLLETRTILALAFGWGRLQLLLHVRTAARTVAHLCLGHAVSSSLSLMHARCCPLSQRGHCVVGESLKCAHRLGRVRRRLLMYSCQLTRTRVRTKSMIRADRAAQKRPRVITGCDRVGLGELPLSGHLRCYRSGGHWRGATRKKCCYNTTKRWQAKGSGGAQGSGTQGETTGGSKGGADTIRQRQPLARRARRRSSTLAARCRGPQGGGTRRCTPSGSFVLAPKGESGTCEDNPYFRLR